jgi:imidazolonepropionase-like amidohydrolase
MSAEDGLHAWREVTPQAIFHGRKIGRIKDGHEANLVMLPSNPLPDFTVVKDVRVRFKHGLEIKVPPTVSTLTG